MRALIRRGSGIKKGTDPEQSVQTNLVRAGAGGPGIRGPGFEGAGGVFWLSFRALTLWASKTLTSRSIEVGRATTNTGLLDSCGRWQDQMLKTPFQSCRSLRTTRLRTTQATTAAPSSSTWILQTGILTQLTRQWKSQSTGTDGASTTCRAPFGDWGSRLPHRGRVEHFVHVDRPSSSNPAKPTQMIFCQRPHTKPAVVRGCFMV